MIETDAEQEVDQSKATTADVGAPSLWNQGITGTGIRIAVLDTGLDVTHSDLDDRDFRNWSSVLNPPKMVDARSFALGAPCLAARGRKRRTRARYARRRPSDGSTALPASWVKLPGSTSARSGRDPLVKLKVSVPSNAPAGTYTGSILVRLSNGQTLQVPVFASVALHDGNRALGNPPGPQARIGSAGDVYAKWDTSWPSVAGSSGTGAGSDWLVYPVELGTGLSEARFTVYDAAAGDEIYDLYLYGPNYELLASTHPFLAPGVTDLEANNARGPTPASASQALSLAAPAAGRYYLAVSRAKVGLLPGSGDFGAFVLTLDEVAQRP